jgi:hypothetical protein
MASNHAATVRFAQLHATAKNWRLFPNPIGLGWIGRLVNEWMVTRKGRRVHMVQLADTARVRFGLTPGSFDLVGWKPLTITADMVGTTIAQFATVDAKTKGYKRLSPEQKMWARAVKKAGGYAGVAMRVPEAPGRVLITDIPEEENQ